MRGHSAGLGADVARLLGCARPQGLGGVSSRTWRAAAPLASSAALLPSVGRLALPASLSCQTSRRVFSSEAAGEEKPEVSADDVQALAQRLIADRALAERLASCAEVPALLSAASKEKSKESTGAEDTVSSRLLTDAPMPTSRQMKIYSMQNFVPFVGFGFCDNFIMILGGDYIDAKLGIAFGISTMAAAGIGNTISDVAGLWLSGVIETAGSAMGLPSSRLTAEQLVDVRMLALKNVSMLSGMVLGCLIGMVPLLYPEAWRMWESRAQIEQRLRDEKQKELDETASKSG